MIGILKVINALNKFDDTPHGQTGKLLDQMMKDAERALDERDALVKALNQMIEVYWADGDGEVPEPACIQGARAALRHWEEA